MPHEGPPIVRELRAIRDPDGGIDFLRRDRFPHGGSIPPWGIDSLRRDRFPKEGSIP